MEEKKEVAIIVPVYKEELNDFEKLSLAQLHKVLGNNYDVYLIGPEKMDICRYIAIYPHMVYIPMDPKWFESIHSYSQLCMQYSFYDRFSEYEYILLYQLDAWLFRDEIHDFCKLGYDFIGAPIFSDKCGWPDVPKVGNGGFSLRRIETFKDICNPDGDFLQYYNKKESELAKTLLKVDIEDKYFCLVVPMFYDINIAPVGIAERFSWDMNPDLTHDYLKKDFPMGVHAIDKNIRFYKCYINELNTPKIIELCETKHKDFFEVYYQDDKYRTILYNDDDSNDSNSK